ncbi:hypothetical protein [Sphingobacterium griseoflavum]|uniref:Uncharacterized protein n=1 Tax=Sphingobacterium griseoflavum TaxID=1474952 RepID=A0ABQ3HYC0_9SPHI|nr:hypothetical protein [Sphingobacterium griseoflavum]GHE39865.1 hypothetical protein GCM10017764_24010 [Sphingobacterium griseoflavum]
MKDTVKRLYLPPGVLMYSIELESSIAAASATISGGPGGQPDVPQVEDWTSDEDMGSRLGEF